MAVTRLDIVQRRPMDAIPGAEPYERIDGIAHFAVSPDHPANATIIDLDKAPRDVAGNVLFLADFCILRPQTPPPGGEKVLFDVLNRGRKLAVDAFNQVEPDREPSETIDPGDGFLMRHGWTVAWCGWQWDVPRSAVFMGMEAPDALENDRPIEGQIQVEFQPNVFAHDHLLSDRDHLAYAAADMDQADAVLTVRDSFDSPATIIPRDQWRFACAVNDQPEAADTHIWLDSGFVTGKFYQAVYRTRRSPVVGSGLLAVRDFVSFLRNAKTADNPCAIGVRHAVSFGRSQSGRFLRTLVYFGLNVDEENRQVFDGLLVTVAGARRGEFNHRFAQPSVQYSRNFGHLPPFTDAPVTDPYSGLTVGLLDRQTELGGVPKILSVNSSPEYWRGDASLQHTTPDGSADLDLPANTRSYLMAGTQHFYGIAPLKNYKPIDGTTTVHPFNTVDHRPILRALLIALDEWLETGTEPPASRVPRLDDGTAATTATVLDTFRNVPHLSIPEISTLRVMRTVDLGDRAAEGVGAYPPVLGEVYPAYVSAVDDDGNEIAGVRLPDITVPIAAHTGWNPRHPSVGGEGQIVDMIGGTMPFAATRAAREALNDPRPSIDERYAGREDYLERVRAAAETMAAERYLLAEDIDLVVSQAAERYDVLMAQG